METQVAASRIVAVECSYTRRDGRHVRQVLLVPMADDPQYGAAVVNMRAENAAVEQVRKHAAGNVYTHVHASIPLDSLAVGTGAPELVVEDSPRIGTSSASVYREHRPNA
jgi:hypothetical protein